MESYKLDIDKIRSLSFNKGMSLSMLCKEAGMSRSRATEWKFRGVYPGTVYRIAQVLNVEPEELVVKSMEESNAKDKGSKGDC